MEIKRPWWVTLMAIVFALDGLNALREAIGSAPLLSSLHVLGSGAAAIVVVSAAAAWALWRVTRRSAPSDSKESLSLSAPYLEHADGRAASREVPAPGLPQQSGGP